MLDLKVFQDIQKIADLQFKAASSDKSFLKAMEFIPIELLENNPIIVESLKKYKYFTDHFKISSEAQKQSSLIIKAIENLQKLHLSGLSPKVLAELSALEKYEAIECSEEDVEFSWSIAQNIIKDNTISVTTFTRNFINDLLANKIPEGKVLGLLGLILLIISHKQSFEKGYQSFEKDFFLANADELLIVNTPNLNCRPTPTTKDGKPVNAHLKRGEKGIVLEKKRRWIKARFYLKGDKVECWVSRKHVKKIN